jgi:hypothetical protein
MKLDLGNYFVNCGIKQREFSSYASKEKNSSPRTAKQADSVHHDALEREVVMGGGSFQGNSLHKKP